MHGKRAITGLCSVASNRKVPGTESTFVLSVRNEFIASSFRPGQFAMIKPRPESLNPLLARPFSIFRSLDGLHFEVLYRVVGTSTALLSRIAEGSEIEVTGPLGNGFSFPKNIPSPSPIHIVIAGGIGIAPLYSIPEYLRNRRIPVGENQNALKGDAGKEKFILYYGALKKSELYFTESLKSSFDEVRFATDDGSSGFKGNVLDLLWHDDVIHGKTALNFYSCGPNPMLKAAASRLTAAGMAENLQLSLEESFGCGIGACLGCAVKINKNEGEFEYKRVCKDGPVFYAGSLFDFGGNNIEAPSPPRKENKSPVEPQSVDLSVRIGGLALDFPVMPASGTFGYGEEFIDIIDYGCFGAIVTKGISLEPSKGNDMPRICDVSCGMINSIGLQNIGLERFKDEKMPFLRGLGKPVIVNFYGKKISDYAVLAKKLSETDGVAAIEANISCPNVEEGGRAFGSDPETVYELVSSVKEATAGRIPLIVKLTPMVSDIAMIAEICEKAGADALSLINTIPAAKIDIKTMKFKLGKGSGGLSGPAVKPVAVKLVNDVYKSVRIPVIGMGGISCWEDAAEFFLAGASAVAVGTYSFVNPNLVPEIVAGLRAYLAENGFGSIYKTF